MTKRNLTLGSASGKLGSVVYMRRRGQQIARLLVDAPADPRTLAQCGVRASFANYVTLWRSIKPYVGDTWRGVSRYGSTENAFYKHSRGLMPAISLQWSRAGAFLPNTGLVTYGSLPVSMPYRYFRGSHPATGLLAEGVYLLGSVGPRPPLVVGGLLLALQDWGVSVRFGDVFHVMMYSFNEESSSASVIYPPNELPRIVHNSVVLETGNNEDLATALPDFTFGVGRLSSGEDKIFIAPSSSYSVPLDEDVNHSWAITMWFERPTNPQFSRFSRSSFAFEANMTDIYNQHRKGSTDYNNIARTYQSL